MARMHRRSSQPINRVSPISARLLRAHYQRLLRHFGPQGWWPVTPPGGSRPVYRPGHRLTDLTERARFEICLGAILTQNTSWSNVERVLSGLSARRRLLFSRLRVMPLRVLEPALRSSGYYRQKARRVRDFLRFVSDAHKGSFRSLLGGPSPRVRVRLLALPGIGPETADAMMLYAGGHPVFVVDAYTRRIGARWGVYPLDLPYDALAGRFVAALPRSAQLFGEYHALLVKLGKAFCRTKPLCAPCPLRRSCPVGQSSKPPGGPHDHTGDRCVHHRSQRKTGQGVGAHRD